MSLQFEFVWLGFNKRLEIGWRLESKNPQSMFQLLAFPIDLSDSKLGVAAHTHYPNIDFLAENAHKNIFQVV